MTLAGMLLKFFFFKWRINNNRITYNTIYDPIRMVGLGSCMAIIRCVLVCSIYLLAGRAVCRWFVNAAVIFNGLICTSDMQMDLWATPFVRDGSPKSRPWI